MLKHNLVKISRRGDLLKLVFCICFCSTLIFLQKTTNTSLVVRDYLFFIFEPIRSVPNTFVAWYYDIQKIIDNSRQDLQSTINYLEKQNELLTLQVHHLSLIKEQNAELLKLLEAKSSIPDFNVRLAEVKSVSHGLSPYEIIINLNNQDGLEVGQAVIHNQGVVGRISSVGIDSSKVLLLTAPSSAISVYSMRNGLRAMAYGISSGMRLDSPDTQLNILPEDLFLATGLDAVFPAGYPVGRIKKVQSDRYIIQSQMESIVPLHGLRRVLVLIPKTS